MTKPFGQPTRGFTAPNRLRLVDTFVLVALREHLRSMPGLFVDLGYGALPLTTVESFERFRRLNPAIRALGVEIDPQRVADAEPFARAGLDFRRGGFNLPLEAGEPVSLVRAFNVLRQYEEHEVEAALDTLARSMTPGAWLIEGTSDPPGRHVCFWAWRRSEEKPLPGRAAKAPLLERRWLVFGARLHTGFSPRELQPFLPKELIHHAEPGGTVDSFFAKWDRAWLANAALAPRRQWSAAARQLAAVTPGVDARALLTARGLLAVRPEVVLTARG